MQRFYAVLRARNIEFMRDRSALAWNLALPFFIVVGFAFAFSGGPRDIYKVGIYDGAAGLSRPQHSFFHTRYIQFIPIKDISAALSKVQRHQLDMLFDVTAEGRYWINTDSPKGYVLERLLLGAAVGAAPGLDSGYSKQTVTGAEVRYVDWLMPGVLGMNMMFSCLFGIGYVIVRYRKNGVLKRLRATPLSAFEFLSAQVVSRLLIIMLVSVIVYIGCDIFIGFRMDGSYLALFMVFALGAMCLISMGLLTAARIASEELAGGILNMLSWPMMFLSGVWFSLEGTHPWVQKLALIFPLTHIIDASRAIMIDGVGLAQVSMQMMALTIMTALFLALASAMFRWQ